MNAKVFVKEINGYPFIVIGTPKGAVQIQCYTDGTPCSISLAVSSYIFDTEGTVPGSVEYGPLVEADNTDSALPIQEAEAAFQDPGEAAELVPGVDYELPGEAEGVDLDVPVDEFGCKKETL